MATHIPSSKSLSRTHGGSGSRLLTQLGIAIYSIIAGLVLIRSLFLSIGIEDSLWVGSVIYGLTDPLVAPIRFIPGGDFTLVGDLAVADLTVLAVVLAVPVILAARRPR